MTVYLTERGERVFDVFSEPIVLPYSPYQTVVGIDEPSAWYRLDETAVTYGVTPAEDDGFDADIDGVYGGNSGAGAVPTVNQPGAGGSTAAVFDGSADYISLNGGAGGGKFLLGSGAFSIETVISYAAADSGIGPWISEHYNGGIEPTADPIRFWLGTLNSGMTGDKTVHFGWYNGVTGWELASGTTQITPDVLHHVVGVYDGSEQRVYLDGVLEGTNTTPGTRPTTGTWNDIYIGRFAGSAGTFYWKGLIDEPAFYDYALSPDRILVHYQGLPDPADVEPGEAVVRALTDSGRVVFAHSLTERGKFVYPRFADVPDPDPGGGGGDPTTPPTGNIITGRTPRKPRRVIVGTRRG